MTPTTLIVFVVLVFIAIVIAVDSVRQRKIRAMRAIDIRGLVTARLAEPGPAVLTSALASALTREQTGQLGLLDGNAVRRRVKCRRERDAQDYRDHRCGDAGRSIPHDP